MIGCHHQLNGHEFEQAPWVGDGQGSLACCSPRDLKESDTPERLNWTELLSVLRSSSLLGQEGVGKKGSHGSRSEWSSWVRPPLPPLSSARCPTTQLGCELLVSFARGQPSGMDPGEAAWDQRLLWAQTPCHHLQFRQAKGEICKSPAQADGHLEKEMRSPFFQHTPSPFLLPEQGWTVGHRRKSLPTVNSPPTPNPPTLNPPTPHAGSLPCKRSRKVIWWVLISWLWKKA